jgi:hypothetical protein
LYLKPWQSKGGKRVGIAVQYRTADILAHAPKGKEGPFFYPAAIEYGITQIHRPPVAPMRRTVEADGDRARQVAVEKIEAATIKYTRAVLQAVTS